jgi:hypothetical protein
MHSTSLEKGIVLLKVYWTRCDNIDGNFLKNTVDCEKVLPRQELDHCHKQKKRVSMRATNELRTHNILTSSGAHLIQDTVATVLALNRLFRLQEIFGSTVCQPQ